MAIAMFHLFFFASAASAAAAFLASSNETLFFCNGSPTATLANRNASRIEKTGTDLIFIRLPSLPANWNLPIWMAERQAALPPALHSSRKGGKF
jgi:hypothetical protein